MARKIETVGCGATIGEMVAYCEGLLKSRNRVKVRNNTYLTRDVDPTTGATSYSIRLHATDVVVISPTDSRVWLDNGGWDTVTTRDRLNTWAPWVAVYRAAPYETVVARRGQYGAPVDRGRFSFPGTATLLFDQDGFISNALPYTR